MAPYVPKKSFITFVCVLFFTASILPICKAQQVNSENLIGIIEPFQEELENKFLFRGGNWTIDNGSLTQLSPTKRSECFFGRDDWKNYVIETKVFLNDTKSDFGILFRAGENSDYYTFRLSKTWNVFVVEKYANYSRVFSKDIQYNIKIGNQYVLKVEAYETLFTFYINNEEVFSFEDSDYASGKVGLFTQDCSISFDYLKINSPKLSSLRVNVGGTIEITGIVYDKETLLPVSNILVSVNKTLASTKTDESGCFRLIFNAPDLVGNWTYVLHSDSCERLISLVTDKILIILHDPTFVHLIGDVPKFSFTGHHEYDGNPFNGSITLSEFNSHTSGIKNITVTSIQDYAHNITAFSSNVISIKFIGVRIGFLTFFDWQLFFLSVVIGCSCLFVSLTKIKKTQIGLLNYVFLGLFVSSIIFAISFLEFSLQFLLLSLLSGFLILFKHIVKIEFYVICPDCGYENPSDCNYCQNCNNLIKNHEHT